MKRLRARGIGAFFGSSTWLPFAANIERALGLLHATADTSTEPIPVEDESDAFVRDMIALGRQPQGKASAMSILLGHGDDDAYVDITLGRQAKDVLSKAGSTVEWKEHSDAEEEGHWFKVPDQMDDIYQFIKEKFAHEVVRMKPKRSVPSEMQTCASCSVDPYCTQHCQYTCGGGMAKRDTPGLL